MPAPDGFRLSPSQRYLWSKQQLGTSDRHVARCRLDVEGPLNYQLLQSALDGAVAHHEILRTAFVRIPGLREPVQTILEATAVPIEYGDSAHFDTAASACAAHTLSGTVGPRHRDGVVLRARAMRLSPEHHLLALEASAMNADATTLRLLATELAERYAALSRDASGVLPQPLQYADLAEWLNLLLESAEVETARRWWNDQGGFARCASATPGRAASRVVGEFSPASLDVVLSPRAAATLSRARLLACAQVLSWRLTGEAASCIGVGVDGRASSQLTQALGPFERFVPVHGSIDPDLPFSSLTDRADALIRACETRAHFLRFAEADFCWPIVIDQTIAPSPCAAAARWTLQSATVCNDDARIRLSCSGPPYPSLRIEYDQCALSESEALRWGERLHTVLEQTAGDARITIGSLDVVGPRERQTIAGWNPPARTAADACLDESFERIAAVMPDRTAVVCDDGTLTYGALDAWANRVAADLQRRGVEPDEIVALRTGRSVALMAGLVGILKSGAAYLPIEPLLPQRRVAYQLNDCRVRFMLVAQDLDHDVAGWSGERIVLERASSDPPEKQVRPRFRARPENLAYVIYTSGSTGQPKGVAVEHRHVAHYVRGMLERLPLPSHPSFASVSSFAMDLGNTALYLSLATGGALHLVSSVRASDSEAFAEYMDRVGIDVLKIVPSHLESLLVGCGTAFPLPRTALILGGETPSAQLLTRIGEVRPGLLVLNHYGPTETTIGAATFPITAGSWTGGTPPIGRPLPNTSIHLLDERLRPAPIGAVAEMYIGGGGVARGYVNLPGLTSERFVTHPAGSQRLYKTGDRGRYLDDGHIQFLGRADGQLKIRGFRIEPGEVESAILEADGVRQAAVVGTPHEAPTHIAAYIVPDSPPTWLREPSRLEALRAFLADRLPEQMVPTELVILDALPLTPNGKKDHRRLPSLGSIARRAPLAPPRDALELELTRIWEDVLDVRPIGVTDSFFQLGGHSLLAVRLLARLRHEIDPALSLATLFQGPTVRELAATLRSGGRGKDSPLVPLQPRGSGPPFFCVHGGWGDVLCYTHLAQRLGDDQPFFGLQAVNDDGASVEQLAAMYLDSICGVQPSGPYHLGGWSFGGVVACEMASQLRARGAEVRALVLIDAMPPGAPDWSVGDVLSAVRERIGLAKPALHGPESVPDGARWLADATRRARIHHDALRRYSPRECDVPTLLIRAQDPIDASSYSSAVAWRRFLPVLHDVRSGSGNHFNMLEEPHVAGVAMAVREFLVRDRAPLGRAAP